ncbi:MAG: hypothetical protein IT292_05805 [Deltaproteobacteria bacterium]|nr:hypothetical protein [Deltaproteobacteria bacterium]
MGTFAKNNQLIAYRDYRLMVWNDYTNKASGASADFTLIDKHIFRGWSHHTVVDKNRL